MTISLFPSNVFSWAHEQSEIVEDLEFIHRFNNMDFFFLLSLSTCEQPQSLSLHSQVNGGGG